MDEDSTIFLTIISGISVGGSGGTEYSSVLSTAQRTSRQMVSEKMTRLRMSVTAPDPQYATIKAPNGQLLHGSSKEVTKFDVSRPEDKASRCRLHAQIEVNHSVNLRQMRYHRYFYAVLVAVCAKTSGVRVGLVIATGYANKSTILLCPATSRSI